MGNEVSLPRKGSAVGSRSGEAIPKLGDVPRSVATGAKNSMSLALHLNDLRQRADMTPPEREWRRKWILDQKLHPDEPIRVEAVYRQLNPLRRLYRLPWDMLYVRVLEPRYGTYAAQYIRQAVPKVIITYILISSMWYHLKYEKLDWTHRLGWHAQGIPLDIYDKDAIEREHPGLIEKGTEPPKDQDDYTFSNFKKRTAYLNVGQTQRPW